MSKQLGRPTNPDSLKRTGQLLTLWLRKEDVEKLKKYSKATGIPRAIIIRSLIDKLGE